jgi:protein dithiol oxidoreductase (disulfide-forming)
MKNQLLRFLFILVTAVIFISQIQAKDYGGFNPEGYRTLKTPSAIGESTNNEQLVQEFFWYGCPHCANFLPYLHEWEKTKANNIKLEVVPVIFRPSFENHARAFYAAKELGVLDKFHQAFFDLWHKQNVKLEKKDKIADFAASLGIDKQKFIDAMASFNTEMKIRQARLLQKKYQIDGVPAVVINQKYVTSATEAGGTHEGVIEVMEKLLKNNKNKNSQTHKK